MIDPDDAFGHNPQVQYLRSVFGRIENAQREFLLKIGIPPFDERLRHLRRHALAIFEGSWGTATQMGIIKDEAEVSLLYLHCLSRALAAAGTTVPREAFPEDARLKKLIEEVSR